MHETERRALIRQRVVLARFGALALTSDDLSYILTEACRLVGRALGTDLAKVMAVQPEGKTLLVRAGVGWNPNVIGHVIVQLAANTSEAHALKTNKPVVSPDIAKETRFVYPPFLIENGVKAVANVIILGAKGAQPYGILQIDSRRPRHWTPDDVAFLRSYANLLGAAVDRLRVLQELRAEAERRTLLTREVDHRARNMLQVMQAAIRLTRADSIPEYTKALEGRLAALARAQSLLSADQWSGVDLPSLIRGELEAFMQANSLGASVSLRGPAIILPPGAAQPFSMAIHELATNAVKYGALSVETGRVAVSWSKQSTPDPVLRMTWAETGGPEILETPTRRGFGTRVLVGTLRSQLSGLLDMQWHRTGLVCVMEVPLRPPPLQAPAALVGALHKPITEAA